MSHAPKLCQMSHQVHSYTTVRMRDYAVQLSHANQATANLLQTAQAAGGRLVDGDTVVFDLTGDPRHQHRALVDELFTEAFGPAQVFTAPESTEPEPFGVITPAVAARVAMNQLRASGSPYVRTS